jgi:hypothetical protein
MEEFRAPPFPLSPFPLALATRTMGRRLISSPLLCVWCLCVARARCLPSRWCCTGAPCDSAYPSYHSTHGEPAAICIIEKNPFLSRHEMFLVRVQSRTPPVHETKTLGTAGASSSFLIAPCLIGNGLGRVCLIVT